MSRPLVGLTIAGSDPSGGAGIQADLKTFAALGVYGTAVITVLTAQNTLEVTGTHAIPADFVGEQLVTLAADLSPDAVKIGMLPNCEIIEIVRLFLQAAPHPVVVLDPVMVSTTGRRLMAPDAVDALRQLLPHVSLVTPNLDEAAALLGCAQATDVATMLEQARRLVGAGAQRVLLKGGHLAPGQPAIDVLVTVTGERVMSSPRIVSANTHGTGCTLSSAIAALRPQRTSWEAASSAAKEYLSGAIAAADSLQIGRGRGPVHHFHRIWPGIAEPTQS